MKVRMDLGRIFRFASISMTALCTLSSVLLAAPPQITGGNYLSDQTGGNFQEVIAWENAGPYSITVYDPDPGDILTVDIYVAGPLGGIEGSGMGIILEGGIPHDFSPLFLAGVTPGISWIGITARDATTITKRYINFDILPNPDPPQGEIFEVGEDADPYHFLVMITDPTQIQIAHEIIRGRMPQMIVAGDLIKGNGEFNLNPVDADQRYWSWYQNPSSVYFTQMATEICDGAPCGIEPDLNMWISAIGYYCPWNTFLREYHPELAPIPMRLTVSGGASTVVSWDPISGASSYDVIRGRVGNCLNEYCSTSIGPVICIVNNTTATNTAGQPDNETPMPGEVFFYLVRYTDSHGTKNYGSSSAVTIREPLSGDCLP